MASSVSEIIARRRQALISAFIQEPTILVQSEGPARLALLGRLERTGLTGGEPQKLGRFNAERTVFVNSRVNPDLNASVWTAAGYDDYRKAYIAFLKTVYGVAATRDDLAGQQVDHLLNRARSPKETTLIRIEAVRSEINHAWGILFEKASSDPRFFENQSREPRSMSYMICAKLAEQPPPRGPNDKAGIDRLANFFDRIGIARAEAREGVERMLAYAYHLR